MASLKDNRLLIAVALAVALFWAVAPFVPNPYLSSFFSLLILIAGTLTLFQYAWATFEVVVLHRRSDDEFGRGKGSHLAIFGIFLFAFGSVTSGAYGLWWNINGQPLDWIGSSPSQFGRACVFAGFCLMQVSPEVTTKGLEIKSRWWLIIIGATILIGIGFYFGLQVKVIETTDAMRAWKMSHIDKAVCPTDRAPWGPQSSGYRPIKLN